MPNELEKSTEVPSATDEENRKIKPKNVQYSVPIRSCTGNGSKTLKRLERKPDTKNSPVKLNKVLNLASNVEKVSRGDKVRPSLEEIQSKLDTLSETYELDSICWEAAANCMKKNRELLLRARREINELRTENQQLNDFLRASKIEGEKYKNQLENEVLRKMLDEFY